MEKFYELSTLTTGDKVILDSGEIVKFIRLKKTFFEGIINDRTYNIPIRSFNKVIEKIDTSQKINEIKTLKKGDLFYIQSSNGAAELYKFENHQNQTILGINPISQIKTKIHQSLYFGKVSNL